MRKIIYLFLAGVLCLQACMKADTSYEDNVKANEQAIQQYISSNNLQLQSSSSGLWYKIIMTNASGKAPVAGNQLVMSYVGKSTNGIVFDKDSGKADRYIRFPYGAVSTLPGIYEMAGRMKSGDSALAVMPFYLAFGDRPAYNGKVPAFSAVVFDLKLLAIQTEDEALRDYIVRKQYPTTEVKKTASGMYYYFTKKDTTGIPASGKTRVDVAYKGNLLNGYVFDQTKGTETVPFGTCGGCVNPIVGFSEALKLMRTKEKAVFMMPSNLAYGDRGVTDIAPYSPLIFEIEIKEVQ